MTAHTELEPNEAAQRTTDDVDWAGIEQRLHERYTADDFFCRIFDRDTQLPLGDLIDLSLGGLGLMSPSAIAVGKEYRLRVVRTVEGGAPDVFDVDARCAWIQADMSMEYFDTGFEFQNMPEASRAGVQRLIDLLGD